MAPAAFPAFWNELKWAERVEGDGQKAGANGAANEGANAGRNAERGADEPQTKAQTIVQPKLDRPGSVEFAAELRV